jgi:ABC-type antimicrobial peptide transport system permease subunit
MFINYLTIALRLLLRNKIYVAINLFGLAFALACCMWAYLNYDFRASFDAQHKGTGNIYRINSLKQVEHASQPWALSPLPLAEVAISTIPSIEQVVRVYQKSVVVKKDDNALSETIHYSDPAFFNFFTFPLKGGTYQSFKDKSAVISADFARKYFATELPIGGEITMVNPVGEQEVLTVIAVMDKQPLNSSFQFDIIVPFDNLFTSSTFIRNNSKGQPFITTFVKIEDNESISGVEKQLNSYVPVHNQGRGEWKINSFYLQPFKAIALSSDRDFAGYVYGSPLNANPRGVVVIVPAVMSLFILLITCFNFTNISVAFASRRLKEIGIRKVMGGVRIQLMKQFLMENLILGLLASLLAVTFLIGLIPTLNNAMGIELQLTYTNVTLWALLVLLPALTAFVSGLYPAIYISSFQPVQVLKGNTTFGSSNLFTRLLLTVQFSICSLALISGIILSQNAAYQEKVDFGYDIENVVVVELTHSGQYTALKDMASKHPKVEKVSGAVQQIGDNSYQVTVSSNSNETKAQVAHIGGAEYLQTMGIKLSKGRQFYADKGLDSEKSIIVNQTLVKSLHLQHPVGEQIKIEDAYFTIIGVVEDYKEYGLHGLVPPCILRLAKAEEYKLMVVRAGKENLTQVNQFLQASWQKLAPGMPYNAFLQSELTAKEKYLNEGFRIVSFFLALVTILLSSSGLFVLVSLNVIRRSKEIAIRKVLGAGVWQMITFINRDFIRLMLIAFTIGSLLGYVFINGLLFRFIYVYHPQVGLEAFVATFFLIIISCVLTVGVKVYRAASANPVKVLHRV